MVTRVFAVTRKAMVTPLFLVVATTLVWARRMNYRKETTKFLIEPKGVKYDVYFPWAESRKLEKIVWDIECVPLCDMGVSPIGATASAAERWTDEWDRETDDAQAYIVTLTEDTHVVCVLTSYTDAEGPDVVAIIAGVFAAAAALAILVAFILIIIICAFCWATESEYERLD